MNLNDFPSGGDFADRPRGPISHPRAIVLRDGGYVHGPVRRLMSPSGLGIALKPFVFLDQFRSQPETAGFGFHPHSGIATVTVLFTGEVAYEDTTGAAGRLEAGGIEYMQAGSGAWHTGKPLGHEPIRGFQLWIALPKSFETAPPQSIYLGPNSVPVRGPVRTIIGNYDGMKGPLPAFSPVTYLHVKLRDGERWTFVPPAGQDIAWIAVDGGTLHVSGAALADEIAIFARGDEPITCSAEGQVDFVVGAGAVHPFPLVTGYHSVHTSEAALATGEATIRSIGEELRHAGRI